jgi:hypothetical protein
MQKNERICQLQLSSNNGLAADWSDVSNSRKRCSELDNETYCIIKEHPDRKKQYDHEWYEKWPLYSLRPSLNRVSEYSDLGYFNTDPKYWPYLFEFMYGVTFVEHEKVKAIMVDSPYKRVQGHVSTY